MAKTAPDKYDVAKAQLADTTANGVKQIIKNTPQVDIGDGVQGWDVPSITQQAAALGADPAPLDHAW
jgi:hypothetical protein